MSPKKKTSLSNSFKFNFDDKLSFIEGIVGGIALAWLVACILSWILNILPVDWSSALTTTTASVAILLMFLGFCSFFAISIASALREGNYGLYSISSFSAFWIIFIIFSYIYGLNTVTNLFFNEGILCMIQIMVAYTLTIYTLSDIKAINIRKSDSYIIGVIPFIALLIFLVVQQQVFGEQIQFGAVIEPVLWVISVIVATLVGYLLHATISK
ncbi:hypothetical protein J7K27_08100 [Candidatus Bathyarchaeota archaeon]|nr:hypothetical protein [Candidatus Bathyarchaeota archaeon]